MFRKVSDERGYVFDAHRTALVYFPIVIVCLIAYMVLFHGGLPYEVDQVKVHLSQAFKTNNIDAKLTYMEETLVMLEPYHGNYAFMFPTEKTDIGATKRILRESIDEIKTELNTQEEERWVFIPHNELNSYLNEQIEEAYWRIDAYTEAYYSNPTINVGFFAGILFLIGGIIAIISIDSKYNSWRHERYFFVPKPPEQRPGVLPKGNGNLPTGY